MTKALVMSLEAPLQAWGEQGRFVDRPTNREPTKSGVAGLLCCCLGVTQEQSAQELAVLATLEFGVRIDRPGRVVHDYQTIGVSTGYRMANGKIKEENKEYNKSYLCDARFIAVWRGDEAHIGRLAKALRSPVFTPFLGRRGCSPSTPLLAGVIDSPSLRHTVSTFPQKPVRAGWVQPESVWCVTDHVGDTFGGFVQTRNDVAVNFLHRQYVSRSVLIYRSSPPVAEGRKKDEAAAVQEKKQSRMWWAKARQERLEYDDYKCVVCQSREHSQVHHTSYLGRENNEILRTLCSTCHQIVSHTEQMRGMGGKRIDPLSPLWFDFICSARLAEARKSRSHENY